MNNNTVLEGKELEKRRVGPCLMRVSLSQYALSVVVFANRPFTVVFSFDFRGVFRGKVLSSRANLLVELVEKELKN